VFCRDDSIDLPSLDRIAVVRDTHVLVWFTTIISQHFTSDHINSRTFLSCNASSTFSFTVVSHQALSCSLPYHIKHVLFYNHIATSAVPFTAVLHQALSLSLPITPGAVTLSHLPCHYAREACTNWIMVPSSATFSLQYHVNPRTFLSRNASSTFSVTTVSPSAVNFRR
jgi:hypothetical protein